MNEFKKTPGLALGIDTGGTYTDGVLLDRRTNAVLQKTKTDTTREDLSIGIDQCIRQLDLTQPREEITMVCLSTTLATNSVVEGKRARVGLILMYQDPVMQRFTVDRQYQTAGRISIGGDVEEEQDEADINRIIRELQGTVDALVVSGYLSIRNPAHELRIRELAAQHLDVPIICAHELSMDLGFFERTTTAVMNAHLLPVIDDLVRKTKQALADHRIDAPLMIVKGDGAMMEEAQALERPVETILSGPAASVIGGAALTKEENALFVDLGGTTTDIAYMCNGKVSVADDGAVIGGSKTKVRAADIHTFGLGGDSRLRLAGKEASFGPMKAVPVCFAAAQYPYLMEEMKTCGRDRNTPISGFHRWEGLIRKGDVDPATLSALERKIVGLLSDGPHSAGYLAEHLTKRERIINVDGLLRKGFVMVISLTPTDLLHASGEFVMWNRPASAACLALAAEELGMEPDAVEDALIKRFADQLAYAVMESALHFDGTYEKYMMTDGWLYDMIFRSGENTGLACCLRKKLVGVGAPAQAWLSRLADRLNTEVSVPQDHEVANAIGAAKGLLRERMVALLRHNTGSTTYRIHLPWGVFDQASYEEAQVRARQELEVWADHVDAKAQGYRYAREWSEEKKFIRRETDEAPYESHLILEMTAAPDIFQG